MHSSYIGYNSNFKDLNYVFMDIKEAIDLIWETKKAINKPESDILANISKAVSSSLDAMLKGDTLKAKRNLEDSFYDMLIAFRLLDIDIDKSLNKLKINNISALERSMHIYSDRVEIHVGDQTKGGWALWSTEDLIEAFKVAQEFNCKVIMQDMQLLEQQEGNNTKIKDVKTIQD